MFVSNKYKFDFTKIWFLQIQSILHTENKMMQLFSLAFWSSWNVEISHTMKVLHWVRYKTIFFDIFHWPHISNNNSEIFLVRKIFIYAFILHNNTAYATKINKKLKLHIIWIISNFVLFYHILLWICIKIL